ncbi:hypothetical protein Kpol_1031p12 [Vanderwaltozyma polyspora DSM 70294]|uniref:Uncharacterized protein n=1 Tax=Vanderwaltozyma polyspora (strain ATCC 22028 / DSM 70294 / BCRC 21397 / CBS 2163 / NBRC 10782 / NRRL Y-8283 / UCD 57-17) TaxID=436907 RepID=A7THU6_VANPO|nr:uncharacterized protein Kpol_1031p12 [Vanderwaltozyma polyspora DSM 70294]EDO18108.1 hypothetical protein Kpol_1031p12 [Vanderwaltozyma polyspora DSM 70294]
MVSEVIRICSLLSFLTSAISFITSFIALFPQIIQTYKDKTVEAISPYFLTSWLIGDVMSLVGAILTNQLYFQIVLAVYFLVNDLVLCGQYYYYGILYKNKLSRFSNARYKPLDDVSVAATSVLTFASQIGKVNAQPIRRESSPTNVWMNEQTIGLILSWLGAVFYVGSRLPQLLKNYKRKSTDGISPSLFWMTFTSNVTYNISIVTSEKFLSSNDKRGFILNELPFIIGNSGTIIFDIVYFYQHYILYRETQQQQQQRINSEYILDEFNSKDALDTDSNPSTK